MENLHTGQVFRHMLNHLSMQALWNLCMHGRTLAPCPIPFLYLDKHILHNSHSSSSPSSFISAESPLAFSRQSSPATTSWVEASLILCLDRGPIKFRMKASNFLTITIGFTELIRHFYYFFNNRVGEFWDKRYASGGSLCFLSGLEGFLDDFFGGSNTKQLHLIRVLLLTLFLKLILGEQVKT